jgi:hypothetical protein
MIGFNRDAIIKEVKETILQELVIDKEFKKDFLDALGIKEDVIILNGDDIKIEVVKK